MSKILGGTAGKSDSVQEDNLAVLAEKRRKEDNRLL